MPRPTTRRLAVAAATSTCLAVVAAPALAEPSTSGSPDSSTVSLASTGAGTRQLELLDLAGNPLVDLALRPGAPAPFRVKVTDTGVGQLTDANSGFTVSAVLNNLYAGGVATAAFIPASDVTVSFPAGGAMSAVGDVTALPRTLLNGTILGCTDLLALTELLTLDALSADALCDAVGSTGLTITDLPVVTSTEKTLTGIADVPFTLAGQQPGAFTLADYVNGIGAADTRGGGAAGTSRGLLSGTPAISAGLAAALDTVEAGVQALEANTADGTNGQTSASAVVGVLLASADPTLSTFGDALSALTPTQIEAVLDTLNGTVQDIGLGDILGVTGSYNAVPVLTATPSATPAIAGTYTGTMTVTLTQP